MLGTGPALDHPLHHGGQWAIFRLGLGLLDEILLFQDEIFVVMGEQGPLAVDDVGVAALPEPDAVGDVAQQRRRQPGDHGPGHLAGIVFDRGRGHDDRRVGCAADQDARHVDLAVEGFLEVVASRKIGGGPVRVVGDEIRGDDTHGEVFEPFVLFLERGPLLLPVHRPDHPAPGHPLQRHQVQVDVAPNQRGALRGHVGQGLLAALDELGLGGVEGQCCDGAAGNRQEDGDRHNQFHVQREISGLWNSHRPVLFAQG